MRSNIRITHSLDCRMSLFFLVMWAIESSRERLSRVEFYIDETSQNNEEFKFTNSNHQEMKDCLCVFFSVSSRVKLLNRWLAV